MLRELAKRAIAAGDQPTLAMRALGVFGARGVELCALATTLLPALSLTTLGHAQGSFPQLQATIQQFAQTAGFPANQFTGSNLTLVATVDPVNRSAQIAAVDQAAKFLETDESPANNLVRIASFAQLTPTEQGQLDWSFLGSGGHTTQAQYLDVDVIRNGDQIVSIDWATPVGNCQSLAVLTSTGQPKYDSLMSFVVTSVQTTPPTESSLPTNAWGPFGKTFYDIFGGRKFILIYQGTIQCAVNPVVIPVGGTAAFQANIDFSLTCRGLCLWKYPAVSVGTRSFPARTDVRDQGPNNSPLTLLQNGCAEFDTSVQWQLNADDNVDSTSHTGTLTLGPLSFGYNQTSGGAGTTIADFFFANAKRVDVKTKPNNTNNHGIFRGSGSFLNTSGQIKWTGPGTDTLEFSSEITMTIAGFSSLAYDDFGSFLISVQCPVTCAAPTPVIPSANPNRDLNSGRGQYSFDPAAAPNGTMDLDALTGLNGNLGVAYLASIDRIYVSSRGSAGGTAAPHTLTEIDPATGAQTNSWNQPSSGNSAWGYRDGTSDDVATVMFGWDGAGVGNIEFFDPLTGLPTTTVIASNGPQTVSPVIASGAPTTTARALAFDPNGNGGSGSIFTANFGSDIFEIDLNGALLNTFPFNGATSLYGLAFDHDRSDPNLNPGITSGQVILWGNSSPNEGRIVEILVDRNTGTYSETGNSFAATPGLQGGCSMGAGQRGASTFAGRAHGQDLLVLNQATPDTLAAHRLERWDPLGGGFPLVEEVDLLQSRNGAPGTDAAQEILVGGDTSWDFDLDDGIATPRTLDLAAYFVNLPGSSSFDTTLDPLVATIFPELDEIRCVSPFSAPAGDVVIIPTTEAAGPLSLAAHPLRSGRTSGDRYRVQGVYADLGVSPASLSVMFSNQCPLALDLFVPSLGFTFTASGINSFNNVTTSGFFSLTNSNTSGFTITRLAIAGAGSMVFDTDQGGMADEFWAGNSTDALCNGTYRNGSGAVLDYALTSPAMCVGGSVTPGALTGFNPAPVAGVSQATLEFLFIPGTFGNGVVFEFDCDTDGGAGITGADMVGMQVTIDYFDGAAIQTVTRPMVITVPGSDSAAAF